MVVASMNKFVPVIQDVIGHGVFIATILMINALLFLSGDGVPHALANWIVGIALVHLGIWYGFQMWLMRLYREKDAFDWLIRGTLILEFVYSNVMTLVLIGSYLFFGFNLLARSVSDTSNRVVQSIISAGRRLFLDFGYTEGWGTRAGS